MPVSNRRANTVAAVFQPLRRYLEDHAMTVSKSLKALSLTVLLAPPSLAYDYEKSDPAEGPGQNAPWRATAQWDTVDEVATKEIHDFTTDSSYLTPMVSYLPEDPAVPSPRDVLGYVSGAEGKLTHPDDTARYFKALADASPNVELQSMGKTEYGRDMLLAVVSSAANLARLDEWKGYTLRLADPRNVTEAEAIEISKKAKPIFHITAGLHSPETGPPEMVMELAYRVAVSNHPDIVEMRDNVIFLITPVTDVDGRAQVVEWYYRYLQDYDSRFYMPSTSPPYWGKYSFHDNNRDGIQLTQALTLNYLNTFNEWHPVYSLDLHESVPLLYVSGGTGPYNPTLDPIVVREWQLAAHWELQELQKHGLPGVWTWGFYDGWNPGYLLWITNNRNSMGRFYETFGNGSARTMERDLRDAEYAGKKVTSEQWYRPDPPEEKVEWSLRNNTNYMQAGVLASLTFTARNGDMLLYNFWKKGRNSVDRGKNEAPHAFLIPRDQPAPDRVAHLLNQLRKQGIEFHQATAAFTLEEDLEVKEGDYIVRLDQPYGDFARSLLGIIFFPEDAEHRPYDDVSWPYGLIYGVDVKPIEDDAVLEVASLALVQQAPAFPGKVIDGPADAYALKHTGQNTLITARYRLKDIDILAAEEAFDSNGQSFPAGSWILRNGRGLNRSALETVARELMLDFHPLSEMPEVPVHELDLPRIALYHNWVSTQDDGWVRYTLEQYGIPYDYINDDHIKDGNLNSYDVILMADQGGASPKSLVHGRDTKFGPMPYTKAKDFDSHGVLDSSRDITGGIGYIGLANLEKYLNGGGTLMLLGSSGQLATDMGLLRNVSSGAAGVDTPGSSIQTQVVRRDHPIAYGYEDINHVFRSNNPLFSVPEHYDHWVVVKYGTKPLREEKDDDKDKSKDKEASDDTTSDDTTSDDTTSDDTTSDDTTRH